MFIRVNNEIINTNRISYLTDSKIIFDDKTSLDISSDDYQRLVKELVPEFEHKITQSKTSELATLLNTLNKLVGGRDKAKLTSDRKRKLKKLLTEDEFTEEELIIAATGLGNNAFMQGENDSDTRYGTIDWLLRNPEHVNRFLEQQPKKKKGMF